MKRLWLIVFAALVLMVTDHGQFWLDDLCGELFPDDEITITVSSRIPGFGIEALDLQPATLPVTRLCPRCVIAPTIYVRPPVYVPVPRQPYRAAEIYVRPPPVLA